MSTTTLDLMTRRHQSALDDSIVTLLAGVPAAGSQLKRDELGGLIQAAFQAGLVAAYAANKFAQPNGDVTHGKN